ncbi:MAG: hypothetical protein KF873_10350 [Gemmataceae bacterium]|nr:hypothetical protein [Gemmataceae bacterium]
MSALRDFRYVAWFLNLIARPEDQDREWCACFYVAADDGNEAQAWGDKLAVDYARRSGGREAFIRSYLDPVPWNIGKDARVVAGKPVSDEEIGW